MGAEPRRTRAAALLAGLLLAACGGREREPSALLVTIDTLRADRLSCLGYERETTPHLDALAAEGVLFERAYTTAPFTAPAHASLFTSLVTRSHGVDAWGRRLDPGIPTLFRLFSAAGLRTGAFHNHPGLEPSRLTDGADVVQVRTFEPAGDTVGAFLEWVDRSERPFAAWVHLWDAHRPYGYRSWDGELVRDRVQRPPLAFGEGLFGPPHDPLVGRTEAFYNLNAERLARPKPTSRGERRLDARDLEAIVDRYDGGVRFADAGLGRLVAGLRARGRLDSTVLVVTSDHGEALLERERCLFTHDPFLYEETLRVPLVVRLPGGEHAGRRVADLVRGIDVLPTLLERSGVAAPPGLQGRSLMPLARGELLPPVELLARTETRNAKESAARADEPVLERRRALVFGRHKLIEDLSAGGVELYDLASDPGETRNLASDPAAAGVLAELRARLAAALERLPEREARGAPTADEEALLDAIGYAGDG